MLVKKYEAKDMQQAMDDIVKELGSEAVILNSRKIRKPGLISLFSKPMVEVMVAYEPKKPREATRKPPLALREAAREAYGPFISDTYGAAYVQTPPANSAAFTPALATPLGSAPLSAAALSPAPRLTTRPPVTNMPLTPPRNGLNITPAHKYSDIDSRIDSLDHTLNDFMHKLSHLKRDVTYNFTPAVEQLLITMCDNQVREELAFSLAKEAEEILKARADANAYEVMHHLLVECLGNPAPIALKKFKQKVILFIGPTGVGKTTSLVKLASAFAINYKKKVGIINTDTYRIAAHEQLKTYADILDIPLGIAYRMEDVAATLEEMSERDLIFIDTAGKRPGDLQHQQDIKQIISFARPEEIFLCVSAPTCFSALREVVDTYTFAGDYKLLITKLDETRYRGMVLNTVSYAKKSLTYVTTGQNVPDDLEGADPETLASQILEK